MTRKQERERDREEARQHLLGLLRPGDTVYTVLRSVSSSGMSRHIDVYAIRNDRPIYLTGWAAKVLGYRRGARTDALVVGGAGMDMGFHVVYSLSRALFPDGFKCIGVSLAHGKKPRCPANDHSNDYGQARRDGQAEGIADDGALRDYIEERLRTDLGYRRGRKHDDGGYALNHAWL